MTWGFSSALLLLAASAFSTVAARTVTPEQHAALFEVVNALGEDHDKTKIKF
jgi:hypothetical protein